MANQGRKLSIWISDDGLEAGIRSIFPETTAEDVLGTLAQNNVTTGIDAAAIQRAVETAQTSGNPVRDAVLARGTPPKPAASPRIEFRPPEDLSNPPPLDPVVRLLAESDVEALKTAKSDVKIWFVRTGTPLAKKIIPGSEPGVDVRGEPVIAKSEADNDPAHLQPGSGVSLAPNGVDYVADLHGYAGLIDGRISVVSPIWLSKDAMHACWIVPSPPVGADAPAVADLRNMLEAAGVQPTFTKDAHLKHALEASPSAVLVPLAKAKAPVLPKDADPVLHFPHQAQVGALRADGSIDFKERNLFPSVQEGMCIAECDPPTPGVPGENLKGESVAVDPPVRVEFAADQNARLEPRNQQQRAIAEIEGGASVKITTSKSADGTVRTYAFSVLPLAQVPGDVNYDTGNLDFKGNIEIRGDITSGFRVTASGDIVVSGSIENGAQVLAGGNITVQLGIVGEDTHLHAEGNLTAKFIQNAEVEVGGDVLVGSYIHTAKLRVTGTVRVEGRGGSGGGIVGGEVWALKGVETRNLGSERSASTAIYAGVQPDLQARMEKAQASAQKAETLTQNLLEHIGLPALRADAVRELLQHKPAQKNLILHYVKKANQLAQLQNQQLEAQKAVHAQIVRGAQHARVDVSGTAYTRVIIHIGATRKVLAEDLGRVRFALARGAIVTSELKPDTKN